MAFDVNIRKHHLLLIRLRILDGSLW